MNSVLFFAAFLLYSILSFYIKMDMVGALFGDAKDTGVFEQS